MRGRAVSVKILLADGDPGGVRFLGVPNWTGLGLAIPRGRYGAVREEPELGGAGLYLLHGPDPWRAGRTRLRIGRAEELRAALDRQAKEHDWWETCLCFTTTDDSLTSLHLRHLEAALLRLAREAALVALDGTEPPDVPVLARPDAESTAAFLEHIRMLAALAGAPFFDPVESPPPAGPDVAAQPDWRHAGVRFHYRGVGPYEATASYPGPRRFVVHAGSAARSAEQENCPETIRQVRQKLRDEGVLVPEGGLLRFACDRAFVSPDVAASVIVGGTLNGRTAWRTTTDRSLNDLDDAEPEPAPAVVHLRERTPVAATP